MCGFIIVDFGDMVCLMLVSCMLIGSLSIGLFGVLVVVMVWNDIVGWVVMLMFGRLINLFVVNLVVKVLLSVVLCCYGWMGSGSYVLGVSWCVSKVL